jgi:PAS domain S-box-containing protein
MKTDQKHEIDIHSISAIDDLHGSLLNEIEDTIYVSTPDTYELVFVNNVFKKNWGEDVIGKKCYKVLQNRDEPCPFCTNPIIFGDNQRGAYVWEFQNEITKRWYRCSDKAIYGQGDRLLRFEIASDITEIKQVEFNLAERIKELAYLNKIAEILNNPEKEIDTTLHEIIDTLPNAFQHPAITCAELKLENKTYKTSNFTQPVIKSITKKSKPGEIDITLTVGLITKQEKESKTAFLEEEKQLLKTVINLINNYLIRSNAVNNLIKSESRFRSLFEHSLIGKSVTENNGNWTVNESFAEMLGYTVDEMKDKTWEEISHPDDSFKMTSINQKLKNGKISKATITTRLLHKKGNTVWAEVLTYLERDRNNTPLYFFSAIKDITQQREYEESLKEKTFELSVRNKISDIFLTAEDDKMYSEVLNVLLDSMQSNYGIFGYINENGDFVAPTTSETVWEKGNIANKSIVFPKETWEKSTLATALKEKKIQCVNQPSKNSSIGQTIFSRQISAPIIFHNKVIGLIQVANKKTDYSEKDLKIFGSILFTLAPILDARLNRDLETKRKNNVIKDLENSNQELEQFAYVASHDLQEPLRMVASFTNLIQKKFKDKIGEKGNMYIQYATDGATRMQTLINDLLDISRISTRGKEFDKIDCNTVLAKALINLKYSIEKNNAIITNDELPIIYADENQLVRVFQNLISNAIKFRGKANPQIRIECSKENVKYRFCISDNGIGIEKDYFEKIFIIFQRLNTRNEYQGTGIGLSICKRIINRHKGEIWVDSIPGKGSKFYFTLPIKP